MLLVVSTLAAYLLLCAWAWPYTMDDAFISFRYAKHIADGIGPIWNLADRANPVEGYTSFLHVWLLGAIRFITGADPVVLGKLLGAVACLLLMACIIREIQRYQLHGVAAAVALSFLVLPFTALTSVSGMETSLFMLWNWLCAMVCIRLLDAPTKPTTWLFVLFGLLGTLTRPEFAAAFLLMAAYVWWRLPAVRTALVQAMLVLYALPGVAVTAWRYFYYGDLVPNPFYAKQARGLNPEGYFSVIRFLFFCALPYLITAATAGRWLWNKHRNLLIVVSLNLGITCSYFTTTKPFMNLWFRFLLPQIPLLAFCAAMALKDGQAWERASVRYWRVGAVVLMVLVNLAYLPVIAQFLMGNKASEERYREVGRRLRPFAAEDRWLLYVDVGAIVYESEWNTIDIVGLNTRKKTLKSPCEMQPDVVLQLSSSETDRPNPCPRLYQPLADLPFMNREPIQYNTRMRVFVRSDIAYADQLRKSLVDNWPEQFKHPADWIARLDILLGHWALSP